MIKKISKILILLILLGIFFIKNSFASEVNLNTTNMTRYHNPDPITVPEKDITITISNLTKGCNLYLLLPENLLQYNMEKFINNNLNNVYEVEAKKAEDIKKYLDKKDFVGYVEYYKGFGFNQEKDNEAELRHYCFAIKNSEVIDEVEVGNNKYVSIKIDLIDTSTYKIIAKDYLVNYDISEIKFMVDDYGTKTYIDVPQEKFKVNSEHSNITECNFEFKYCEDDEYESINRMSQMAYKILFIILLIIALIILFKYWQYKKDKKEEKEERYFWKKKLTKEEKKELKRKKKWEKRLNKSNKRK